MEHALLISTKKAEYASEILASMREALLGGVRRIFNQAEQEAEQKKVVLRDFQLLLRQVPSWTRERKLQEAEPFRHLRHVTQSLQNLYALNQQIYGPENCSPPVDLVEFVHSCYVNIARELFSKAHLVHEGAPSDKRREHLMALEKIVTNGIKHTLRRQIDFDRVAEPAVYAAPAAAAATAAEAGAAEAGTAEAGAAAVPPPPSYESVVAERAPEPLPETEPMPEPMSEPEPEPEPESEVSSETPEQPPAVAVPASTSSGADSDSEKDEDGDGDGDGDLIMPLSDDDGDLYRDPPIESYTVAPRKTKHAHVVVQKETDYESYSKLTPVKQYLQRLRQKQRR